MSTTVTIVPRKRQITTDAGWAAPIGATVSAAGVNFSLFSRAALRIELLLFDHEDQARPAHVTSIDTAASRTYHYWHVFYPRRSSRPNLWVSRLRKL